MSLDSHTSNLDNKAGTPTITSDPSTGSTPESPLDSLSSASTLLNSPVSGLQSDTKSPQPAAYKIVYNDGNIAVNSKARTIKSPRSTDTPKQLESITNTPRYQKHPGIEKLLSKKENSKDCAMAKGPAHDPLCFVHSKFDGFFDITNDLSQLSINTDSESTNTSPISHQRLVKTASNVRELAKQIGKATIDLNAQSIMIVTKARDNSLVYLTRELTYWLIKDAKKTVYVDAKLEKSRRFGAQSLLQRLANHGSQHMNHISSNINGRGGSSSSNSSSSSINGTGNRSNSSLNYWTKKQAIETPETFDLAITLGGDGTVLYMSKLFQRIVPPTIAFSLGSLGFLTNFRFEDARKVLSRVFSNGINVNLRMRFSCAVYSADKKLLASHEVLNEIVIDRGPSPWISMLELYGNNSLLTVVQADGLILSTPTGSTAYSLSAGGSLVHPEVSAVSVTPICPHTLSFRPMLLPDSMVLRVTVPKKSRSTAWASFDGHDRMELRPGDYVTVSASKFPFPTIVSSPTEYIDSVSRTLKWNVRQQQMPFEHLLQSNELGSRYQHLDLKSSMSQSEWDMEKQRYDRIEEEEYELMAAKRDLKSHRSSKNHHEEEICHSGKEKSDHGKEKKTEQQAEEDDDDNQSSGSDNSPEPEYDIDYEDDD